MVPSQSGGTVEGPNSMTTVVVVDDVVVDVVDALDVVVVATAAVSVAVGLTGGAVEEAEVAEDTGVVVVGASVFWTDDPTG